VIICSPESEETSHIVSKLLQQKRDYTTFQKDEDLSKYIRHLLKQKDEDYSYKLKSALKVPNHRNLDPDK